MMAMTISCMMIGNVNFPNSKTSPALNFSGRYERSVALPSLLGRFLAARRAYSTEHVVRRATKLVPIKNTTKTNPPVQHVKPSIDIDVLNSLCRTMRQNNGAIISQTDAKIMNGRRGLKMSSMAA